MPKQKDGRYRKKITIPGVGVKYASGTTRRELEENARRIREKFIDGIDPRSVTFQELILEWFNVIKRPRIKTAATLRNYQNAINVHIMPFFPEMQLLRAVRRADLQACLDACTGMNETTIRLVRAVLIHAMEYAVAEGMLAHNIASSLMWPAVREKPEKQTIGDALAEKLLTIAETAPNGLMIPLLYYLGLRRGEMLALQWGDFDWDSKVVHIRRAYDFTAKKPGQDDTPKTAQGERTVPLPDALIDILRPHRSLPHLHLLSDKGNQPLSQARYRYDWNHIMKEADCLSLSPKYAEKVQRWQKAGKPIVSPNPCCDYKADVTPHTFRHTYITACVLAGIPAEYTMRIVGHADYTTTINIYTHIDDIFEQDNERIPFRLANVLSEQVAKRLPKHVVGNTKS